MKAFACPGFTYKAELSCGAGWPGISSSNHGALPDDYLCSPTLCSDAGVIEYAPTRMDLEGTRVREQPASLNDN
jgi:hypothetical protein